MGKAKTPIGRQYTIYGGIGELLFTQTFVTSHTTYFHHLFTRHYYLSKGVQRLIISYKQWIAFVG